MNKFVIALFAVFLVSGCHAQIPSSPAPMVSLTWTAPIACTTAVPCVYAISRAAAVNGVCPPATGAYALVGTSTSQAATYVDSSPLQGLVCYIGQTQQSSLTSIPSNSALVNVPAVPTAPTLNTPTTTTSQVLAPEPNPANQLASNQPLNLKAVMVH